MPFFSRLQGSDGLRSPPSSTVHRRSTPVSPGHLVRATKIHRPHRKPPLGRTALKWHIMVPTVLFGGSFTFVMLGYLIWGIIMSCRWRARRIRRRDVEEAFDPPDAGGGGEGAVDSPGADADGEEVVDPPHPNTGRGTEPRARHQLIRVCIITHPDKPNIDTPVPSSGSSSGTLIHNAQDPPSPVAAASQHDSLHNRHQTGTSSASPTYAAPSSCGCDKQEDIKDLGKRLESDEYSHMLNIGIRACSSRVG